MARHSNGFSAWNSPSSISLGAIIPGARNMLTRSVSFLIFSLVAIGVSAGTSTANHRIQGTATSARQETCNLANLVQGFPWEIFKPRTLKEVISITTKAVRPDDSMFLATNQLESKVEVVFTGQSRPIIKARKTFITTWVGMLHADDKNYADLFEREYLYKEGPDEYWLATSTPITKYFDKELKPGDKMDLYLISIGAYRDQADIDCVLLVEEFQKPAAQQARPGDAP